MPEIRTVALDAIDTKDRTFVFRHSLADAALENSLRFEGLIHPVTLLKKKERWTVVSGYLRVLAARAAEMETVQAVCYEEKELEHEELLKIAIAENTKRRDLKPVEIAEALERIQKELALTTAELAESFGLAFGLGTDETKVARYMELNRFNPHEKDVLSQTAQPEVAFDLLHVENRDDRAALLGLLEEHKEIKKAQFGKMVDGAKKLRERSGAAGFDGVLKSDSVRHILDDESVPETKKINAFLAELEKQTDPDRVAKTETLDRLTEKLAAALAAKRAGLDRKISVRKPEFGQATLKITLTIDSTADLVDAMKTLYEEKDRVFKPLLQL